MGIWLDTAIGMVLFFLAMSLVVTAAVEALAQAMSWRANTLRDGIDNLLRSVAGKEGGATLLARFYDHTLLKALADSRGPGLARSVITGKAPSYIPARVFAAVLLDIATRNGPAQALREALAAWRARPGDPAAWKDLAAAFGAAEAEIGRLRAREQAFLVDMAADRTAFAAAIAEAAGLAPALAAARATLSGGPDAAAFAPHEPGATRLCELLSRLSSMVDRSLSGAEELAARLEHPELRRLVGDTLGTARASVEEARAAIARWFDDSMERVSGWYKRRTQVATFLVALGAAILANASAFQAAIIIHGDARLRSELVAIAQSLPAWSTQAELGQAAGKLSAELARMPIGWNTCERVLDREACAGGVSERYWTKLFLWPLGWLVTALATTIGAPFWFDMLSMLMRLRASGPVPAARKEGGGAAP